MRRLTHLIVLAAFISSCGGHWAVFRAIAWASMIREYSEMVPVMQAVQMTFSGQYPCAICRAIAEKKNSEGQKAFALEKTDLKFIAPLFERLARKSPVISFNGFRVAGCRLVSRTDAPPTPPPRSVQA